MSTVPQGIVHRVLKEPLLHFMLLGAGLFIVYAKVSGPGRGDAPRTIVVTAGRIEHLAAGFAKTWKRPPTREELDGLIDDWIRDEVATRQATALGLDKDDAVIRRRLRQKLEFVSEDIAARAEPTDAELNAYLQAHPDSFRQEPRFTFHQVYLDPSKHGDNADRDAARLLARLSRAGANIDSSTLGDSVLLDHTFRSVPAGEIAKQFGDAFAAELSEIPPGRWQGPIESGYGLHLVLVDERTQGRVPALPEVREAVRREWANAKRLEGSEAFYRDLLKRYTVTIERPDTK